MRIPSSSRPSEGFRQQSRRQQRQRPKLTEPDCAKYGGSTAGVGAGGTVADGSATDIARQTLLARHQGQVGHRGRQVQLEPGLGPPEVASLANPQLHQPGQPVLHHHPPLAVPGKGLALLPGAGLLQ